jgi:hypothetical protein
MGAMKSHREIAGDIKPSGNFFFFSGRWVSLGQGLKIFPGSDKTKKITLLDFVGGVDEVNFPFTEVREHKSTILFVARNIHFLRLFTSFFLNPVDQAKNFLKHLLDASADFPHIFIPHSHAPVIFHIGSIEYLEPGLTCFAPANHRRRVELSLSQTNTVRSTALAFQLVDRTSHEGIAL